MIKNWVTKKNVLIIAISSFLLMMAIFFFVKSDFCYHAQLCQNFFTKLVVKNFLVVWLYLCLAVSLFVLPFSLITYKMQDEIFISWMKFVSWIIPPLLLIVFAIYKFIDGQDPYAGGGIILYWIVLYLGYFFASIGLIFYKSWKLKGTDTKA